MSTILRGTDASRFPGCDVVVQLGAARKNTKIRLLQLTDTQMIDASQRRTPERLRPDEIAAWDAANMDAQCGSHIRSVIAQSRPDLIFLTGDITYGSFDDTGSSLVWFCRLMEEFGIPWAPVFGNHDNESRRGVDWQCAQFEKRAHCLFVRGNVTGNGNYTVGIAAGDELIRVLHMTDSCGCRGAEGPGVKHTPGIYPDQAARIAAASARIEAAEGRRVPAFFACHIPTAEFRRAEEEKGYCTADRQQYSVGVDFPAQDGDFGSKLEFYSPIQTDERFLSMLKACAVDGVFFGHCHRISASILWEGIRWTFGLKTGQYDYHLPGMNGGTLVMLEGDSFDVMHVPSLSPLSPYPGGGFIFERFFAAGTVIEKQIAEEG